MPVLWSAEWKLHFTPDFRTQPSEAHRLERGTHMWLSVPLFLPQGGSFDVADRMFHSVKSTWESASKENMSDVRELTPEFFYLPEFLTNCNAVEFGE